MVVLKFSKVSNSSLTAHVDMLRAVTYIFRRAGIDVAYSKGFNPHMELGFSAPIALGVESTCEYVCAKTDFSPDMVDRLNAVCPQGICFQRAFNCSVNLASKIDRAKYVVSMQGIGDVVEEVARQGYTICYLEKGKTVQKDVSSKVFSATRVDDNTAILVLGVGNNNLRPDRVVNFLQQKYNLQGDYAITKTQAFVGEQDFDDFLSALEQG